MTKQVGLYMLGAIPLLIVLWEFDAQRRFALVVRLIPGLALEAVVAALAAAPIYLYAEWTIRNGTNTSEFGYLVDGVFQGLSYAGRASAAVRRIAASPGAFATGLVVLSSSALLWHDRRLRWLIVTICVPFSLIWAFVFSYDDRNLALALPLWALTSAFGVGVATEWADRRTLAWSTMPSGDRLYRHGATLAIVVGLIGLTALLGRHYSISRLVERQQYMELRELGGEPVVTGTMVGVVGALGKPHRVLSEWRWACAFSFMRDDDCIRIFPETFFASDGVASLAHETKAVLVILEQAPAVARYELALKGAGFAKVADVNQKLFYVRERRP